MEATSLLFALLRHAVCGEELNDEAKCACTSRNLEQVYTLSRKHDLAHLVAHALEGLEVLDFEQSEKLKKTKATAIYRYTLLDYAFGRICSTLEDAQIPFMPLKGSVLRCYYPDPWMRSSCDIDVLVKPEDLWNAVTALEKTGFQRKGKSHSDVSLYTPSGVHLELHYVLTEESDSPAVQSILSTVWEQARRKPGTGNHYLMTDGMFYLYHIAHMAAHFLRGGCGIRPCLDIWILNSIVPGDPEERKSLLAQSGLLDFAGAAEKLAAFWFSNAPCDAQTLQFGKCVIMGGIYGSESTGAVAQKAADTKLRIPFHRILIPFEDLRYAYPVLDRKPWLMPLCQILRWFRLLGILWGLLKKRAAARKVSDHAEAEMRQLLQYLGL